MSMTVFSFLSANIPFEIFLHNRSTFLFHHRSSVSVIPNYICSDKFSNSYPLIKRYTDVFFKDASFCLVSINMTFLNIYDHFVFLTRLCDVVKIYL